MKGSILPGEVIVVNKLAYGARLSINDSTGKSTRVAGYSYILHNDVVVFNYPLGDSVYSERPDVNYYDNIAKNGRSNALSDTYLLGSLVHIPIINCQPYVKRCIALPGDTLKIRKDTVYINGKPVNEASTVIRPRHKPQKKNNTIQNKEIKPLTESEPEPKYHYIFPHYNKPRWWQNWYGPLYIPKMGDSVKITSENLCIYQRIIAVYEHNTLDTINNKIYINSIERQYYTFKQNYYFMMGDNRSNSTDSRFWGFVPENHIIGKVKFVIWSWDNNKDSWNKVRLNRLFSMVR